MKAEEIIKILDTTGVATGVVGTLVAVTILGVFWISRQWIERWIEGKHQEKLKKMEFVLGPKLSIMNNVNTKIWEFECAVAKYVSLWGEVQGEERKEHGIQFSDRGEELMDAFEPNRIYFPEDLAEKIEKLYLQFRNCGIDFLTHVHRSDTPTDSKKWIELNDFVIKEAPQIRRDIENEIRKHMH